MILSAYIMDAALCDTINTVALFSISRIAIRSFASVAKSSAEALSSKIRISGFFTTARAIVIRCRCPPERFLPPCSISKSSPPSFLSTNSFAWATSNACMMSSSVAFSLPHNIFSRIVPLNKTAFWSTIPIFPRSSSREYSRTSFPSICTLPFVAS